MKYKVIQNGTVIDVLDEIYYCFINADGDITSSKKDLANCIAGSGETYYHLAGLKAVKNYEKCIDCEMIAISDDEYNKLKKSLDNGNVVIEKIEFDNGTNERAFSQQSINILDRLLELEKRLDNFSSSN